MNEFEEEKPLEADINFIADIDGDPSFIFSSHIPAVLRYIALRDCVIFPGVVTTINVGRANSLLNINECDQQKDKLFVAATQIDPQTEDPNIDDLYEIGIVVRIMRIIQIPERNISTVVVQALNRCEIKRIKKDNGHQFCHITVLTDTDVDADTEEAEKLIDTCRIRSKEIFTNEHAQHEWNFMIGNLKNGMLTVNTCCTNLPIDIETKIMLLRLNSVTNRAYELLRIINHCIKRNQLIQQIEERTQSDLNKQQREYYLQQEMRNIQNELGNGDNMDVLRLQEKLKDPNRIPIKVLNVIRVEIEKLKRMPPASPDYNIQLNYLENIVDLPWGTMSKDNLDLNRAERIMNRDHYGLEKVKERILEQLAVIQLRDDMKSPIICLYGPPGVGKTSLGRSIAEAMNRKYVRISLGGVSDEAEIRGHRRTYLGAMMGRILTNLKKAGTSNPVFVLDEIDKVSASNHGDPFSALLEVLDPEQNVSFHDNFLDLDYDLSKVMFIATANNLGTIPPALLDRMELIEVPGYLTEEKVEIAFKHLVPKIKSEMGINKKTNGDVKLSRSVIQQIIEQYTLESGVRQLEKTLEKLFRKEALSFARNGEFSPSTIKQSDLKTLLGVPKINPEKYEGNRYAGVVTGLAWTAVGGTILMIEVSLSKGKTGKLTLTGSLGDVMKESAVLAVEYIKSHANLYGIDIRLFDHWNIHVHVPDGATPKDGPSAGITLTTALISALTQRKVRKNLAMTGEITLRGKVTAVGGIREKILAAKRAGITDIILSQENRSHIEEIPSRYTTGLNFLYVNDIQEVISLALLDEKVDHAIDLSIPEEKTEEKN